MPLARLDGNLRTRSNRGMRLKQTTIVSPSIGIDGVMMASPICHLAYYWSMAGLRDETEANLGVLDGWRKCQWSSMPWGLLMGDDSCSTRPLLPVVPQDWLVPNYIQLDYRDATEEMIARKNGTHEMT